MRKPSPATVIASVALFVALGGAAVAATGDTFILGHSNSADATSGLGGTVAGAEADIRNASTATNASGVLGRITSASAGTSSAGVRGTNAGTATDRYGVSGSASGNGTGVYGSGGQYGVQGTSAVAGGAGVLGKNTAGGPALQAIVSGKSVPPLAVNSAARVPNLNADKLDGVDASGFVPSSAVRRVGPVTLAPSVGTYTTTTLATFGQLSFVGYCVDTGTQQDASVILFSSAVHAAFVSVTGGGSSGANVEQNVDFNSGFPVTRSSYVSDGYPTMYSGVGTALSANGHQVSFNVYAGQNITGLTNQKCVFGGTFEAN